MWRSLVSAPALGAGGRRFESGHPDQLRAYVDLGVALPGATLEPCASFPYRCPPLPELVVDEVPAQILLVVEVDGCGYQDVAGDASVSLRDIAPLAEQGPVRAEQLEIGCVGEDGYSFEAVSRELGEKSWRIAGVLKRKYRRAVYHDLSSN